MPLQKNTVKKQGPCEKPSTNHPIISSTKNTDNMFN